jgi:hypothetical protein
MFHVFNGQDIVEMLIAYAIGYLSCKLDNYGKSNDEKRGRK